MQGQPLDIPQTVRDAANIQKLYNALPPEEWEKLREVKPIGSGGQAIVFKAIYSFKRGIARSVSVRLEDSNKTETDEQRTQNGFTILGQLPQRKGIQRVIVPTQKGRNGSQWTILDLLEGEPWEEKIQILQHTKGSKKIQTIHQDFAIPFNEHAAWWTSHGVAHLDPTLRNLLAQKNGELGVIDWATAQKIGEPIICNPGSIFGTPLYMPPEIIRGDIPHETSDLFMGGISAIRLLGLSEVLQMDGDMNGLITKRLSGSSSSKEKETQSSILEHLLKMGGGRARQEATALSLWLSRILQADPNDRPNPDTAREILDHTGNFYDYWGPSGLEGKTKHPHPGQILRSNGRNDVRIKDYLGDDVFSGHELSSKGGDDPHRTVRIALVKKSTDDDRVTNLQNTIEIEDPFGKGTYEITPTETKPITIEATPLPTRWGKIRRHFSFKKLDK